MSVSLELATVFNQNSRKLSEDIEKQLQSDFERHTQRIQGVLRENELKITNDINAQNQRLTSQVLQTWIWVLLTVSTVLMGCWGVIWWQGQAIADNQQVLKELAGDYRLLQEEIELSQNQLEQSQLQLKASKDEVEEVESQLLTVSTRLEFAESDLGMMEAQETQLQEWGITLREENRERYIVIPMGYNLIFDSWNQDRQLVYKLQGSN